MNNTLRISRLFVLDVYAKFHRYESSQFFTTGSFTPTTPLHLIAPIDFKLAG
jgi:hypothetical protein